MAARRFSPAEIMRIHGSTETNAAIARRENCSAELIRQIRRGMVYPEFAPGGRGVAGIGDRSCLNCDHWRGGGHPSGELCDLGHRDPLEEGVGFAELCSTFKRKPESAARQT